MTHDLLEGFPRVIAVPVAWGDQDSFGHVNNVVYIRWCESSRVDYLLEIGLAMAPEGLGPILASIACDYRRPLNFPDTVHVGARVTKIGNSSFRMEHRIVSEATQSVAAEAHSTIVVLDYERGKSAPVPEAVRRAIETVEGRAFVRVG